MAAHSQVTIDSLALDARATVPWWPPERSEVTLGLLLVHMIAETNRHAGHCDIVRELVDGATGLRAGGSNMPGDVDWVAYRAKVERVAQGFPADR